jgi:hypothetical protein
MSRKCKAYAKKQTDLIFLGYNANCHPKLAEMFLTDPALLVSPVSSTAENVEQRGIFC